MPDSITAIKPPNEMPDIVGAKPENPWLASFKPFVPPSTRMRELTPLPLVVGTLLGMVFGASSLYLVLKTGLTVSASIPVAVLSITIFRMLSKLGLRDAGYVYFVIDGGWKTTQRDSEPKQISDEI